MALNKASSKSAKKNIKKASKIASIKQALFGAGKKKTLETKKPPAATKGAKKSLTKPAKIAKPAEKPAKAGKSAAAPVLKGKAAATPVMGKKGAPAPAPVAVAAAPVPNGKGKAVGKNGKVKAPLSAAALARHQAELEAMCREVACEGLSTSGGYCRLHYIKNWKKIKRKELILKEGKLNQYIEELVIKYPDKYIEAIRQDLAGDKDFAKVIYDLDLDESVDDFDTEGEAADNIIDSIKRDFDDEGDTGF